MLNESVLVCTTIALNGLFVPNIAAAEKPQACGYYLIMRSRVYVCAYISILTKPVTVIIKTSKEKHSLTRKLVGYRNWRQR